jgi:hypothetical protein
VSTLRRFSNVLSRTINAWENFELTQIYLLSTTGSDALQQSWEGRISDIRNHMSELRSMLTLVTQKLDLFNEMRNGVSVLLFVLKQS